MEEKESLKDESLEGELLKGEALKNGLLKNESLKDKCPDAVQKELMELLYDNGAALVGFADLSEIVSGDLKYGVSVAVPIPREIVSSIYEGPTMDYYHAYHALNEKLNTLVTEGACYLESHGFKAFAQTTKAVVQSEDFRTSLPHKTVAVNAGLGWIGKSALFVTKQYGSAIRLSSLITDAKLTPGVPVTESRCGSCMACTSACPAKAISGKAWRRGMDRDEFYNPAACREKAMELALKNINIETTLCGKCIEICPYTQNYTRSKERLTSSAPVKLL